MEGYSQDPNARITESRRQVSFQKQTSNIFDLYFLQTLKEIISVLYLHEYS